MTATRLAHVSDVHLGSADVDVVATLVSDVRAAGPTATVVTGDLTMRARTHELDRARELLDALPAPLLVVLGNHDLPLFNVVARFSAPYDAFLERVHPDLDPVLDIPGVRVLGLQSMPRWRWKSGRVSRRQADLVGSVLGSAPAGAARVLALHHPPSLDGLETLAGLDRLRQALVAADVDVVLAGHTHVPAASVLALAGTDGRDHPVLQVVAGTASTRTRGVPASWTVLDVGPDQVTVTPRVHGPAGWADGPVTRWPRRARRSGPPAEPGE